jgi:hypothetical protein
LEHSVRHTDTPDDEDASVVSRKDPHTMKGAGPVTFLSGRYFTADEIEQVRETARVFSALPRHERVEDGREEKQARQEAVEEQLKVYRSVLPVLLSRFAKIRDPRNPKAVKHKSVALMLYGILSFEFQMASQREANRQMTMPVFQENLHPMFLELEKLPHQETLNRLLSKIEVDEIEETLVLESPCQISLE